MVKDENEQAVQETEENQDPQEPEEMADSEAEVDQPDNTATTVSVDEASGDSDEEPNSTADIALGGETEATVVKLEDLKEEEEYSQDEIQKFKQIYESTISKFSQGEIVSGKIISIDAKEASIDIGFKSEGVVPLDEFNIQDELKIGDEIEVYIDNIEDKEGQLVLSRRKAEFSRTWDRVVELYEKDETTKGRICRRIKGGMVVDLIGVEAFLPGSQIDVKPVRDFDALVGEEFEFKIVNVNQLRKNIVVSRRVLIEETMKGQREKILQNLEKGQELEGSIKNITDFGVFIDLGGVDGLLHINDLSWGRIGHPSEVVSLDEKITVVVLDYDEKKTRISLGYKQLQAHPWEEVDKKYPLQSKVTGKVVNIADYGAFIELEKGIEGLVHISEMSWTQHIKHPSQVVTLGDTIEAVVLNVDKEGQKISLGIKHLQPDPWASIEEKYPAGTRHKGVVRNLTNFGAFVELEEGVDGLIHISDLSWTRKIRHPSEVIKKNDEVEVEVLTMDREHRRISLGYKQLYENPWDNLEDQYKVGVQSKGVVTRCIDKGLVVEIPDQVEGFVPLSHLARIDSTGRRRTSEAYKVDDELELTVIEFDKSNKRIVLSEKSTEELQELLTAREGTAVEEPSEEEAKSEKPKSSRGKAKSEQPAVEKIEESEAKAVTEAEATEVEGAAEKDDVSIVEEAKSEKPKSSRGKAKSEQVAAEKPEESEAKAMTEVEATEVKGAAEKDDVSIEEEAKSEKPKSSRGKAKSEQAAAEKTEESEVKAMTEAEATEVEGTAEKDDVSIEEEAKSEKPKSSRRKAKSEQPEAEKLEESEAKTVAEPDATESEGTAGEDGADIEKDDKTKE
jgi:small subunit ribosomal protein S1